MTDRDSAFLWETEALRSRSQHEPAGPKTSLIEAGDWVTLREASDLTGVPTDTIRKWARHDRIPSYLEKTDDGHLRIVSLEGILGWSEQIGRELHVVEPAEDKADELVVDLNPELAEPSPEPSSNPTQVPEGSMLVPLDAWNKMLNQLGNLHEAGQQLAEARERAAKAETEARFLKERLTELRAELEPARGDDRGEARTDPPGGTAGGGVATTLGGTASSLARRIYESWRYRRRG